MKRVLLLLVGISVSNGVLGMNAEQRQQMQSAANERARMELAFAQAGGRPVTTPTSGAYGTVVAQTAAHNSMIRK